MCEVPSYPVNILPSFIIYKLVIVGILLLGVNLFIEISDLLRHFVRSKDDRDSYLAKEEDRVGFVDGLDMLLNLMLLLNIHRTLLYPLSFKLILVFFFVIITCIKFVIIWDRFFFLGRLLVYMWQMRSI